MIKYYDCKYIWCLLGNPVLKKTVLSKPVASELGQSQFFLASHVHKNCTGLELAQGDSFTRYIVV